MAKKIIITEIEACIDCPASDWFLVCEYIKQYICGRNYNDQTDEYTEVDEHTIPDWCPLEDDERGL